MILTSLLFTAITALWWALVWFVLPLDLRRLSIPALISLHIFVPVGLTAAVSFWRRWRARVAQARALAATQHEAEAQQQRINAARDAHAAQLAERRVAMQCRGAWISALTQSPLELKSSVLLPVAERSTETGPWPDAVQASVTEVFAAALKPKPGCAWLPVYLMPNARRDGLEQIELVRKGWRQAVTEAGVTGAPAQADCKFLPGSGALVDRVLALLANDPGLPGCLVLGVDSLTDELDRLNEDSEVPDDAMLERWSWQGHPGRAAALLLFTRAGLRPSEANADTPASSADAYTPYWETQRTGEAAQLNWGRVPGPLQAALVADAPLAALASGGSFIKPETRGNALTRQVQSALEAALINASLRDPAV